MDNDGNGSNLLIVNECTSAGLFPPKKSRGKTPSISRHTQRHGVMGMTIIEASSSSTVADVKHPAGITV